VTPVVPNAAPIEGTAFIFGLAARVVTGAPVAAFGAFATFAAVVLVAGPEAAPSLESWGALRSRD
jgi:hypothetical protein